MSVTTSAGIVLVNDRRELFLCHSTGTPRWDLPKGLVDEGETPRDAAVREAHEESGLQLDGATLLDLGEFPYLPAKRLHLFALNASAAAFDIKACRCRSMFPHHRTGAPTPEADDFAWAPVAALSSWCGKNMSRVLAGLDWERLRDLPLTPTLAVDTSV